MTQSRHPVYAGIGSRETPPDVLQDMEELGTKFAQAGWTLRSGGAHGADTAFHVGARKVPAHIGPREIYLPNQYFGPEKLMHDHKDVVNPTPEQWQKATQIAIVWHPLKEKILDRYKLKNNMSRNSFQVLGRNLDDPADLIVCWTPDGARTTTKFVPGAPDNTGGTGQAIRVALYYKVPVFNLWHQGEKERLDQAIQDMNLPAIGAAQAPVVKSNTPRL